MCISIVRIPIRNMKQIYRDDNYHIHSYKLLLTLFHNAKLFSHSIPLPEEFLQLALHLQLQYM